MKYLIVGLGNIGDKYLNTRHNIGFMVLDALAEASNTAFEDKRYGAIAKVTLKNKSLLLLKPSTFVNLSGNSVRYWLQKEKIENSHLLVIVDDLSLPLGTLRLKPKGGDAGHNGLKHIQSLIGTNYPRLRVGIGSDFPQGRQVDYVLGEFSDDQKQTLVSRIDTALDIVRTFCLAGINVAMNEYNNK